MHEAADVSSVDPRKKEIIQEEEEEERRVPLGLFDLAVTE
jgi:hypothetical protein